MSVAAGPHPVVAPADQAVRRTPSRPPHQRPPGFEAQFDTDTIFFDVVHADRRLILSGPTLREFGPLLDDAELLLDGVPYVGGRHRRDLSRAARIVLDCPDPAATFTLRTADVELSVPVTVADPTVFAGRRVLFTHSQDNALDWVVDWARYHQVNHGTDAVLIYDNASTRYGPADLDAALRAVPGIDVVRVVPWPFRFGPQGGIWAGDATIAWDSDFCQIGAMENARFVHLADAAGVVNADVDELVVAAPGVSVYDRLEAAGGYLRYSGHWIEAVTGTRSADATSPRHADYWVHDPERGRCLCKWSVIPAAVPLEAQWTPHGIYGLPMRVDEEFELAHFRAINCDWKTVRTTPQPYDPAVHLVQLSLVAGLHRAFPETFTVDRTQRLLEWAATDADTVRDGRRNRVFADAVLGRLPPGVVDRHWVWRGSTVVFECSPGGVAIGFDALLAPATVHVSVVARRPVDAERVIQAVARTGRPTVGPRVAGVRLGRWLQTSHPLDPQSVAAEVATWVEEICGHLSVDQYAAEPTPHPA